MEVKVKHSWDDVTIGQYVMLKSMDKTDYPELIDKGMFMVDTIYGIDSSKIPYTAFTELIQTLDFLGERPDQKKKAKAKYTLNGTDYIVDLDYTNFTTSQFIDFTSYRKDGDEIGMLSSVLIPKGHETYMDGYDIEEVKKDIEDYLCVTDAMAIMNFFMVASTRFMMHILSYLRKKLTSRKMKKMSREQKNQIIKEITKLQKIMEQYLMS